MRAADTATALASFEGRGAGTDVERRAAQWLAGQLEAAGRSVRIESFWCRPNWALAHSWHVLLALVGSLVSVSSPRIGGALVLAALISVIADERLGVSPGRRLTLEHASQNVVSEAPVRAPGADQEGQEPGVHLIITANYDAGRSGFVYREAVRKPFARATESGSAAEDFEDFEDFER